MVGKIILAGGHELRPGCEEMDRRVLETAGGRDARVVFLPTAVAHYDPVGSGRGAVAYWGRLGAHCDVAMILNRADADDPRWARIIEDGTLIYLGGGDPDVLLDALQGSTAWEAVRRAHERGAVVGGSSAGAMVVCGQTLIPGRGSGTLDQAPWAPGLGLVPNALVWPHYTPDKEGAANDLAARLAAEVSPSLALLGIPEQQGLLGGADGWEVAGRGPIVVFQHGRTRSYGAGARPRLDDDAAA